MITIYSGAFTNAPFSILSDSWEFRNCVDNYTSFRIIKIL